MKKMILILLLGMVAFLQAPEVKAQFIDDTPKQELYTEINQYRLENGLPALEISESLERSSAIYAIKLTALHSGTNRHDWAWLNRQGKLSGELIGPSYKPVDKWKDSYSHNRALLTKGFSKMGLSKFKGKYVLRLQC